MGERGRGNGTASALMEDPRGRERESAPVAAFARPALFLCLSLWGNHRPFNQTAEIEKQTRTLIIQRRKERGEGETLPKKLGKRVAFYANSL